MICRYFSKVLYTVNCNGTFPSAAAVIRIYVIISDIMLLVKIRKRNACN